jgi:hypothetical protein
LDIPSRGAGRGYSSLDNDATSSSGTCIAGLSKQDRGAALGPLTKEEVQQGAKNHKRWEQPDNCYPEELARKRMVILKDHGRFDDLTDDRDEDDK